MARTIFATPLLTPCLRVVANLCLKLSGWQVDAKNLPPPPYVIISAPHTSNWDFPLMLITVFHLKMDISWMGKHTLFPPVICILMKWLGGIPINRSKAGNVVSQTVEKFKENPTLMVLIPPEGTRKKVSRWKTGFYHIAHQANVPILMAAIDAENKKLCFLGQYKPSGDLNKDLPEIQQNFLPYKGLIPENAWDTTD